MTTLTARRYAPSKAADLQGPVLAALTYVSSSMLPATWP